MIQLVFYKATFEVGDVTALTYVMLVALELGSGMVQTLYFAIQKFGLYNHLKM